MMKWIACVLPPMILFIVLNNLTDAGFFCLFSETVLFHNKAIFKCCHNDGEDYTWFINGLPYGRYFNVSRNDCGRCHDECHNNKSSTLTVLGVREYDNISVSCIATFGGNNHTSSDSVSLRVVDSLENISKDFYEMPQSTYVPMGLSAYFFCGLPTSALISWIVTDAFQQDRRIPVHDSDLIHSFSSVQDQNDSWSVLVVNTSSISNESTFHCEARVNPCSAAISTPQSQLRIQGPLEAPTDLDCKPMGSVIQCSGTQLYSRNLTERNCRRLKDRNIDPEIQYHVCLYNLTCGEVLLRPECNVTKLPFTRNDISNRPFRVTVTPQSNMNTAPAKFEVNYGCFNCGVEVELDLTEVINGSFIAVSIIRYDFQGVIPEDFSLMCRGMQTISFGVNYLSNVTHIYLPIRDVFVCQFMAYGCYKEGLLQELNTYDMRNVSITSPTRGVLQVSLHFVSNSSAAGALLIIARNVSQIEYRYLSVTRNPSQQHVESTVKNITEGIHGVSVFVLEETALPFGATFVSEVLAVNSMTESTQVQQTDIEYRLRSNSSGVLVDCTFLNESITECVAVVHRSLTQHNFSGLMNIKSSHKFTRSGDTASGFIKGVNLVDCQVGVIDGTPQASSSGEVIVPVTVSVVILILLTVGIMITIFIYVKRKKKRKNDDKPTQAVTNQPDHHQERTSHL